MKKIITLILLLCMVVTLAACGTVEITMQEIYDAAQTEAMLKNHQSVSIRDEMDGEVWMERYLTKEYAYEYYPNEEFTFAQFMTDDANYAYSSGDYLFYSFITPDGVGDFASDRAETYASVILGEETLDQIIEAVSKKGGRITVTSSMSQKTIEDMAEYGMTAGKFECALDAKTREMISLVSDYTYEDGSAFSTMTEMTYDAEMPEMLKEFLAYVNQTENLRNVTVVSNPAPIRKKARFFRHPRA